MIENLDDENLISLADILHFKSSYADDHGLLGGPAEPTGEAKPLDDAELLRGFTFDGSGLVEPARMLVKDCVPEIGVCFIGGQSGAGKSFVVVDLAVALTSGQPFFGRKVTERVGVAIMAAEGSHTFGRRIEAARRNRGAPDNLPIAWLGAVPNLTDPKEITTMIPRLQALDRKFRAEHDVRLGAVVYDTLAMTFAMEDENSSAEAAKIVRSIKTIGDATGAVQIPVHHFGKTKETGLRGASGWRANSDAVLSVLCDRNEVTGESGDRSVALTKNRDGPEGAIGAFELRGVQLGIDQDGEPWGSAFIEVTTTDRDAAAAAPKAGRLSRAGKVYVEVLGSLIGDMGKKLRPFLDGPEVRAVDREHIRVEFYKRWPADGETEAQRNTTRRQRFRAGEQDALQHGRVSVREVGGTTWAWDLKADTQ